MPDEKPRNENEPSEDIREEAGPHAPREAIGEGAAQTPTRGEPQSAADREQPVQPASEER